MNLRNEEGITLVEVLASIVILTIILATIMNFFPQMASMNNKNEEKQQATNLVKKEIIYWQNIIENQSTLDKFLNNPSMFNEFISDCVEEESFEFGCGIFSSQVNGDSFDVIVKIKKTPDLESNGTKLHQIHIQLIKENQKYPTSKTYGYVKI